jgi:hypothetical protein
MELICTGGFLMKQAKIALACLLGLLLITACGTANNSSNHAGGKKQTENAYEEPKRDENGEAEEQKDDKKVRLMEQNLTYEINGEQKKETAFLRESDNQDFSLHVLPDYELTGEEPRKDVLYFKENDSQFMRIELLPSSTPLNEAAETAREQLEAVSPDVKEVKPSDSDAWLKEALIYQAENGQDQTIALLIPKKEFLLKLTIFTSADHPMEDPFLKMAETIESK